MFLKNNIKIKQYYRFVEFTLKLLKHELSHARTKLLCLDEFKGETKEELLLKRFADATLYILNNANQTISKDTLKTLYYLLTLEVLEEEKCSDILKKIYIEYDSNTYYNAAKLHLYILEQELIEKENFAFLLTILLILRKEKRIVILYDHSFKEYEEIIQSKDLYRLMLLLIRNRCSNKKYDTKDMPSTNKIKNKIRIIKKELQNKYLIEKIYLYGSCAAKQNTKQSDIDILIKFKDNLLSNEREELYPYVRQRLQELLNYKKLDFIDFNSAVTKMELNALENIITII